MAGCLMKFYLANTVKSRSAYRKSAPSTLREKEVGEFALKRRGLASSAG
jgi:hypothetical protein